MRLAARARLSRRRNEGHRGRQPGGRLGPGLIVASRGLLVLLLALDLLRLDAGSVGLLAKLRLPSRVLRRTALTLLFLRLDLLLPLGRRPLERLDLLELPLQDDGRETVAERARVDLTDRCRQRTTPIQS